MDITAATPAIALGIASLLWIAVLARTAALEEAGFLASEELADTYADYVRSTGRFLPSRRTRDCGSGSRGRMFRASSRVVRLTGPRAPEGRPSDVRASMDGSRGEVH